MSKLEQYAEELAQIASDKERLTNKEETIKELLLKEMKAEGRDKEKFDFGTISRGARRTYTYTEAVEKMKNKLKIKQDEEVKKGLATEKVTEFVSFRKPTTK